MKKLILALVLVMLTSGFVGCNKNTNDSETNSSEPTEEIAQTAEVGDEIDPFEDNEVTDGEVLLSQIPESDKVFNPEKAAFDFTDEEIKAYNDFSETYDKNVLKGLDPISVAKITIQYGVQIDWEAEYEMYDKESISKTMSKEQFKVQTIGDMQTIDSLERRGEATITRKEYAELIFGKLAEGTFVEESETSGYIEFLDDKGEKYKYKLVKNTPDIWEVYFYPIA